MRYDILDSNGKANIHSGPDITWNIFGLQRICRRILTGLGALFRIFHLDCYFQARKNNVSRDTLISEISCHGVTNIEYAEADTAGSDPDLIT